MTKRKTIFTVAALLVAIVLSMQLAKKRYWIREFEAGCQVLWHDDECFVFVGKNTSGWRGSYLDGGILFVRELVGFHVFPELVSRDVLMYTVKDGELNRYYLKGISGSGHFLPANGVLHYFASAASYDSPNAVMRWTGQDFVTLSSVDRERVETSFKLFSDLLTREGWNQYSNVSSFAENQKNYTIALNDSNLVLTVLKSPDNAHKRITLEGPGFAQSQEILCDVDGQWRRVDEQSFSEIAISVPRTASLQ